LEFEAELSGFLPLLRNAATRLSLFIRGHKPRYSRSKAPTIEVATQTASVSEKAATLSA
jgi:hypothetical protein